MRGWRMWAVLALAAGGALCVGCSRRPVGSSPLAIPVTVLTSPERFPLLTFPAELESAIAEWQAFEPINRRSLWALAQSCGQAPYRIFPTEDGGYEIKREALLEQPGIVPDDYWESIEDELSIGADSGRVVESLEAEGGYVLRVDGGADGDHLFWYPAEPRKAQELSLPCPWVNAILLVDKHLWLGFGYSSGDFLLRANGGVAEYALEAGTWKHVRAQEFEQAVLAMSLRDDGTVLIVCDTMVFSCDRALRRKLLYGFHGIDLPNKANWYGSDAVTACTIQGSVFIGTTRGLVALLALEGQAGGLYREAFVVPAEDYAQIAATREVRTECTMDFR